jgi:hypothetical protein
MGARPTYKATGGPGINRVMQNAALTPVRQHSTSHLENTQPCDCFMPEGYIHFM